MAQIDSFFYSGPLAASKSLMNRALIVNSFYKDFVVRGASAADDVKKLKRALDLFSEDANQTFDCGHGGTTFRFLLARLSRESGSFSLKASARLLERPQEPLYQALQDLGVELDVQKDQVGLVSKAWVLKDQPLKVPIGSSSQFATSLLLSAWELPKALVLETGPRPLGATYLSMTLHFLRQLGMEILETEDSLTVPAGQTLKKKEVLIEPDMSSTFALVAFALKRGTLQVAGFPENSLQPDAIFLDLLQAMGAPFELSHGTLSVNQVESIQPLHWNLEKSPDLFPVLAVLLASYPVVSKLNGLENLKYKESDRLTRTRSLLEKLGVSTSMESGVLTIFGESSWPQPFVGTWDPDQDHRMAMAAELARFSGAKIEILHPEVVDKSFPEFWEMVRS